jgi:hypothetical protein
MADKKQGSSTSSSLGTSSVFSLSSIGSGSSSTHISSLQSSGNVAAPFYISTNRAPEDQATSKNQGRGEKMEETKKSFVEQVHSANSAYAGMLLSQLSYEFKLVHGKKQPHWFFMLKVKDSQLPYITLEIQTSDLHKIIPTIQSIENGGISVTETVSHSNATVTNLDVYDGRLQDLCEIADKVVETMKEYNLVSSNCQHFCNGVLRMLGRETFSTTVGHQCAQCKDRKA